MRELKIIIATLVATLALVWLVQVDKSTWSRSGSTQVLTDNGDIVKTEGITYYVKSSVIVTGQEWRALSKLNITHLQLGIYQLELRD